MRRSTQARTTQAAPDQAAGALVTDIPRLTDEEQQRALEELQRTRAFRALLLAERGGVPFPESWPLIREAREER